MDSPGLDCSYEIDDGKTTLKLIQGVDSKGQYDPLNFTIEIDEKTRGKLTREQLGLLEEEIIHFLKNDNKIGDLDSGHSEGRIWTKDGNTYTYNAAKWAL